MSFSSLDTALAAGANAREHARLLRRIHEASLSGRSAPVPPRPVIEDSWQRTRRSGIDPDRLPAPRVVAPDELYRRRASSPLAEVLPLIRHSLLPVAEQAEHIMVVTDTAGQVLWREGARRPRQICDRVGLVEGAFWNERSTGTNAIGTALAVGRPVQVYSAEHYLRSLHPLTCACAPIRDPRDGRLLGAIDATGPVSTIHPSTLALVSAVARLAEAHLQSVHHVHLERLRSVAAPLLAKLGEPSLVVDSAGWTAAAVRTGSVRRVALPERAEPGTVWIPELGRCVLEPLPGGWLVRLRSPGEDGGATSLTLDLSRAAEPVVRVSGPTGEWSHRLTPRHAELLLLLAAAREGRTAAELSQDVFGTAGSAVTVRAELSRLRKHLGGVLCNRPYRFSGEVRVGVEWPREAANLLPASLAPGVRALRTRVPEHTDPLSLGDLCAT
ncbi:GAF domain-containing protein [Nocardiopsis sp. CNT312]|uniref:GAF domain-containing protein n=1 Tax=Nocardiopsis sp. CNT312 TaxID=1137268 RepID=UPI00048B1BA3|nr:GAF domain-containing protein [Nocardiopsis sp. CNT312]